MTGSSRDEICVEELFRAIHVGLRSASVSDESNAAITAVHKLIADELGMAQRDTLVGSWDAALKRSAF